MCGRFAFYNEEQKEFEECFGVRYPTKDYPPPGYNVAPYQDIQVGHKRISSTDVYAAISGRKRKQIFERMERAREIVSL